MLCSVLGGSVPKMNSLLYISIVLIQQISSITSSEGDKSYFYQKCVDNCVKISCRKGDSSLFESNIMHELDIWTKLLWNCKDDCRYKCMWRTVQGFQERGYNIPKFHGKWPFTRMLGVQEPGSAFASLLNLASHVYMLQEIRWRFSARGAPFVRFWHVFAAVCINAWAWSTIFHTRDTPFTEFMDYACALSMVMALFFAAIVRAFHKRVVMVFLMLIITLMYYTQHVQYLYDGVVRGSSIDYSYNMQVNIIFGVFGSLIWLSWALVQYWRGARHAWMVGAFTLWSGAALTLELGEWAPVWGAWDAHAVWHLTTAPLPLLFYRFVIKDLYYLYPTKISEKSDYNKLT